MLLGQFSVVGTPVESRIDMQSSITFGIVAGTVNFCLDRLHPVDGVHIDRIRPVILP